MHEEGLEGEPDNQEVEPDGPVLYIPDVSSHALLHLPQLLGLTTITRHLRPACNARLDEMAHHILLDKMRILFGVGQHVRPRAYHAHIALQHVPELGELVEIGLSHQVAKGELPRVVLRGLQLVSISLPVVGRPQTPRTGVRSLSAANRLPSRT